VTARSTIAADLRERLGMSDRTLADLERGRRPASDSAQRRLAEADRLYRALSRVIQPHAVGPWLLTPNPSFGSVQPLDLIARRETDRLWHTIHELEAGEAL
jgi:transcriptional regulator with XRE-family HTH domain